MKHAIAVVLRTMVLSGVLSLSLKPASADMTGIDYNAQIWDIDRASGQKTLLKATGLGHANAMASDGFYFYFMIGNELYQYSRGGGTVLRKGVLHNPGSSDVRAMAIDEKGDFYMVYNGIGVDELWKFSLGTQIESFVGYIGSDSIQALDFDVFGTLYAWSVRTDRTGGLWTIDPSTGQGRDAFPNIGGPVNVQSISFDYLNRCWAVGYDLILLNVDDQSMVQVGQGGLGDMRGCEFATRKVVPTNVFVKFHSDTNGTIASFRADDFDFFQAIRSAGLGDTTPIVYDIRATGQNGLPTGIQAWVKSRIAVGSASTFKLQLRHGGTTILDTVDVLTEPETSIFKTHKLAGTGDITRYALSNTIGMLVTVTPNSMPTASTWRDDTSFAFWTYEINGL